MLSNLTSSLHRSNVARAGACRHPHARIVHAASASHSFASFADESLERFSFGVMGDLHLAPDQMPLFHSARDHLQAAMSDAQGRVESGSRVVQLGDLGNCKHNPGSRQCFHTARQFLHSFNMPSAVILGNHDLEGPEFETDEENLAAWIEEFQQPHHWCARVGPAVAIGLSTTRFRSNKFSHHEVYIDDEQMAWLDDRLTEHADRPVLIFTHAPPMGCGLKVLQEVHVKNRCAWLNHSDRPRRFLDLMQRHNNIKLWFSGHFHLSHNYIDSISAVGSTAFVQTGVIGTCNRDGHRHSRLLRGDAKGYQLYTVDHEDGTTRLDLQHGWWDKAVPKPVTPEDQLLCEAASPWLCSAWDCSIDEEVVSARDTTRWYPGGAGVLLAHQGHLLVEYDVPSCAPVGLVTKLTEDSRVRLVDAGGSTSSMEDGSDAASVEVVDPATGETRLFPRNPGGGFYQIFQPNKWRLTREKEKREAALATLLGS